MLTRYGFPGPPRTNLGVSDRHLLVEETGGPARGDNGGNVLLASLAEALVFEPGTLARLGLGLVGIGLARRR